MINIIIIIIITVACVGCFFGVHNLLDWPHTRFAFTLCCFRRLRRRRALRCLAGRPLSSRSGAGGGRRQGGQGAQAVADHVAGLVGRPHMCRPERQPPILTGARPHALRSTDRSGRALPGPRGDDTAPTESDHRRRPNEYDICSA